MMTLMRMCSGVLLIDCCCVLSNLLANSVLNLTLTLIYIVYDLTFSPSWSKFSCALFISISYTYTYSDLWGCQDDDADSTITASDIDISNSSHTNGEANMDINDENAQEDTVQFSQETHKELTKKTEKKAK